MKVFIGKYIDYFGSYQLADLLQKVGLSEERCNEIGEWLSKTWVQSFLEWVYEKRGERKIKIKIDPWDTWDMESTLSLIILPMLQQLKAEKYGSPYVEDSDVPENLRSSNAPPKEHESGVDALHFARFDYVLDEMIWAFKELNTSWEDKFHSGVIDFKFEEDPETGYSMIVHGENHTADFDQEGYNKTIERMQNGLNLFAKYYLALWS